MEKQTFDSGLERVDARLGKEIWVGDPAYGTTIAAAVSQIDNNPAILRLPAGVWNITANLTIPANITLKVERGAVLNIATGITLTINGGLEAGVYQIFAWSGTGKVVLSKMVRRAYTEWWGAKGDDGVSNDLPAFQACVNAVAAGTKISLLAHSYRLAGRLVWPATNNISIEGQGRGLTKIIIDNDQDYGIRVQLDVDGITLKDLTLQGLSNFTSVPNYLFLVDSGAGPLTVNQIHLTNCEFAIARYAACAFTSWDDTYLLTINGVYFKNCRFHGISVAPYEQPVSEVVLLHKTNQVEFSNCTFEDSCSYIGQPFGHAIYHHLGDKLRITGCIFNGEAMNISSGDDGVTTRNDMIITDNIFIGVRQNAFWSVNRLLIANNIFYNTGQNNFAYCENFKLQGNQFYGSATFNSTAYNLWDIKDNSSHGSIENNSGIINGAGAGFLLYSCSDITFSNNNLTCDNVVIYGQGDGQDNIKILGGYYKVTASKPVVKFNGSVATNIVIKGVTLEGIGTHYGVQSLVVDGNTTTWTLSGNTYLHCLAALTSGITEFPFRGQVTLSDGTATVTFPSTLANTNYYVLLTGASGEILNWSNKTTTGFTISSNNPSSTQVVDYLVFK